MKYDEIVDYMVENLVNYQSGLIDFLINWFNIQEDYLTTDDLDMLIELCNNNNVEYSTCKLCCNDGFDVHPTNWSSFQGVCEDDNFSTTDIQIHGKSVPLCEDCYNDMMKLIKD